MRVISGIFRSRKLHTLEGMNTRPTLDKVKGAMFSAIGNIVDGERMLDLFAGSGSVGLEAKSRGMHKIYFNDENKKACEIIKKNCELLKVCEDCVINCLDYEEMLTKHSDTTFDLIYIDPPYAKKVIATCLHYIDTHDMLSEYGVIVVETSKEDAFEEYYGKLYKWKEKTYGIVRLTYYRKGV